MKRRIYGFTAVAALLAALISNGPATAGEGVPFKAQSSGVITTVGFDPVKGIVYTHGAGEGEATHLGHFTVTHDVTIDFAAETVTGTWTLTAANGDMLFLTMKDGRGIDPTHGFGNLTIVGGTGRFRGATGQCQQFITFGAPPPHDVVSYTDELIGTISFGPQ